MLYVDATSLNAWLSCREKWRLRYLEQGNGIQPLKPQLPLVVGGATHKGIEVFWRGGSYQEAIAAGMAELDISEEYLSQPERERLQDAREMLPDILACYFEQQTYDASRIWYCDAFPGSGAAIEAEWRTLNPVNGAYLCGKIDRCEVGPHLYDVKTASEIGKNWKSDYRAMLLRDIQFQLYDYYLTSIGHPPIMTTVEVITKPYKGKPPKLVLFDLPELAAYRERFKQQLDWVLREMVHYVAKYREAKPWPQAAATTCVGRFGPCEFLPICNGGANAKVMAGYGPRIEHLTGIDKRHARRFHEQVTTGG